MILFSMQQGGLQEAAWKESGWGNTVERRSHGRQGPLPDVQYAQNRIADHRERRTCQQLRPATWRQAKGA